MNLVASVQFPPLRIQPTFYTIRTWDDEVLYYYDGMSTADMATGSFQEVPGLHTDPNKPTTGFFNAISSFQRLGVTEKNYLHSIQPDDFAQYGFTIAQKMNLFIQPPPATPVGQAYWSKVGGKWNTPDFTMMDFGSLFFGGNEIQVEMENGQPKEYRIFAKYRNRPTAEWVPCFKPIGFRKSDYGRPVDELKAEGKIQKYTVANKGAGQENVYNEHPRGYMNTPLWDARDWPVNNGNTAFYIAKRFLREF